MKTLLMIALSLVAVTANAQSVQQLNHCPVGTQAEIYTAFATDKNGNTVSTDFISYCKPIQNLQDGENEKVKANILKNTDHFSKLLAIPASMITEDELNNCHGQMSSNVGANLIGSCYFSENGSLYILAITETINTNFEIKYPVYQVLQLTSEL